MKSINMLDKQGLKELVGQSIYGIPLSNSINRAKQLKEQIRHFTLVKVTSVNVMLLDDNGWEKKFPIDYLDANNYGYEWYETQSIAIEKLVVEENLIKMRYFRGHISFEDSEIIRKILEKGIR